MQLSYGTKHNKYVKCKYTIDMSTDICMTVTDTVVLFLRAAILTNCS